MAREIEPLSKADEPAFMKIEGRVAEPLDALQQRP
jgi:hypothetical protein